MQRFIHYIFPIAIILHIIFGIWWLAVLLGIAWSLFWLSTSNITILVKLRKLTGLVIFLVIIGVILAAITFKTLFFGVYAVSSESMESSIVPGDYTFVNNLTYGPRLPYSPYEISWINLLVWLWEGKDADIKKRWWKYNRFKGYSSPKRGDVAVFNHPSNDNVFIKRIAAIPGDTLEIKNGTLFINGTQQETPLTRLFYTRAVFYNVQEAHSISDSLKLELFHPFSSKDSTQFNLVITKREIEALQHHPRVIHTAIDPFRPDTAWTVYPHSEFLDWSIDNYGPYILPYKGMAMEKTTKNLLIHGALINHEAQFRLDNEKDSCGFFIFYNDYYFFLGDNFHNSEDSRYFGPVREELLIGKASFVIFSKSKKHKRLTRFLKRIE
jgi:signal peptidase I